MYDVIFPEFDHHAVVIKTIPLISAAHAEIVKVRKGHDNNSSSFQVLQKTFKEWIISFYFIALILPHDLIWLFKFQPPNKHSSQPAGKKEGGTTACPPPCKTLLGNNSLKFHFSLIGQIVDTWPHLAARKAGKNLVEPG